MKRLINKSLRKIGFEIKKIERSEKISFYGDFNKQLNYEFENEANEAIKMVRKQLEHKPSGN